MRPRQISKLTIIRKRFNVECFSPFHISKITHDFFLKLNITTIVIFEIVVNVGKILIFSKKYNSANSYNWKVLNVEYFFKHICFKIGKIWKHFASKFIFIFILIETDGIFATLSALTTIQVIDFKIKNFIQILPMGTIYPKFIKKVFTCLM